MISIASLIYRSASYADALWQSLWQTTPHLQDGRARFFFVANDPTDELLRHLESRGYPFMVQRNPALPDPELHRLGFAPPAYLNRVYRGWNRAVMESDERMVLVSSDNVFGPGWLDELLAWESPQRVVAAQLIERRHPKYGVFPGAIVRDLGDHPDRFDMGGFLRCCDEALHVHGRTIRPGGAFTPVLASRGKFIEAGMFPEGNLARPGAESFAESKVLRYGDQDLFARLADIGVEHVTARAALVYHFKEGEQSE